MEMPSFTAGESHRIGAPVPHTSRPGAICSYEFHVRVLSGSPIPEMNRGMRFSASAALQRLGGRVIGPATAKTGASPSRSMNPRLGVIVGVDLERGAPVWNIGSFVMTL